MITAPPPLIGGTRLHCALCRPKRWTTRTLAGYRRHFARVHLAEELTRRANWNPHTAMPLTMALPHRNIEAANGVVHFTTVTADGTPWASPTADVLRDLRDALQKWQP